MDKAEPAKLKTTTLSIPGGNYGKWSISITFVWASTRGGGWLRRCEGTIGRGDELGKSSVLGLGASLQGRGGGALGRGILSIVV